MYPPLEPVIEEDKDDLNTEQMNANLEDYDPFKIGENSKSSK